MERLILIGWVVLVISFTVFQGLVPQRGDYPNLETRLYKLSVAPNPAKYAATHGPYYTAGKVRVVIELLSEDVAIPPRYHIQIEDRHKDSIQALVPVRELRPLSNESGIKFIRVPWKVIKYR